MQRAAVVLLGMIVVAGGLSMAAPPAAAAGTGVTVYTWTDANGVTHFSDTPRHTGSVKRLSLPKPPPPDRTAAKAEKAWVHKLHQMALADQAKAAARRRARQERDLQAAEQRQPPPEAPQYQYVPIFYPARRLHRWHHRHRHRDNDDQHLPSARFPQYALPSSFPAPLASSFPPGLPSSFPEAPSSPRGHR